MVVGATVVVVADAEVVVTVLAGDMAVELLPVVGA